QVDAPLDRLKSSKPELCEFLERLCPEALSRVADEFKDSLGASKKFKDFVIQFLPSEPQARPPASFLRHDWSEQAIRRSMSVIYGHRSKALHDGIPFPLPMCEVPFRDSGWEAPAERPLGGSTSGMGGTWIEKDTPMLLRTFEYIARNALLNWWKRQASRDAAGEEKEK